MWGWGITHFAKMGLGDITHREEWSRGRHSQKGVIKGSSLTLPVCVKDSSFSLPECCVSGWSKGVLLCQFVSSDRKCHSFCRGVVSGASLIHRLRQVSSERDDKDTPYLGGGRSGLHSSRQT